LSEVDNQKQKNRAVSIRLTCAAIFNLLWMRSETHPFLREIIACSASGDINFLFIAPFLSHVKEIT
jgi:hypothetical protein